MDNQEILNRFDVLYNNITSSQAPGLDGYEKSVFWNKATLEVLKNHLNPKGNKYGEGFDGSSKRQIDFSDLIKSKTYVFKTEDTEGSFNSKALRYGGVEVVASEQITRYYVKYPQSDDDEELPPVITTGQETIETASIVDAEWPTDLLSIVNESVEVLTSDAWRAFVFYVTQFTTHSFVTENYEFGVNSISEFNNWAISFGFSATDPILRYLGSRLKDAVTLHLSEAYKHLTADELLNGIGFGESKSYKDAVNDISAAVTTLTVVPLNNVEYDTLMSRPYKFPPKAQAWRIITEGEPEFIVAPCFHPLRYRIRYVKTPADVNLESSVNSEVPEILHDEILQRAVELAKAAYVGDANQQQIIQTLGERSE